MKNFSVKTADFDSLSISGESPIVQSDLGTAPNQIPLNKDLGSLAYMNAPQIEDLNVDTLELREIAAEMSETAVDVFVYDTRRDSDGGAWRNRTSHTSWYNEELNTATRGGRREFPVVAVIVAENKKITIYDGDDPDLRMWMVFEGTAEADPYDDFWRSRDITSCFMLNSLFVFGTTGNDQAGVKFVDFASDSFYCIDDNADQYSKSYLFPNQGIVQRNNNDKKGVVFDSNIINGHVNDVAMTVLPNAPIDSETGLPVPTIAVATDGGVSVIKDDGSVVDIVSDNLNAETPLGVNFRGRLLYMLLGSKEDVSNSWNSVSTIYIPDNDVSTTYRFPGDYVAQYFRYNGLPATEPDNSGHDMLVPINSQTHLPLAQRSRAINVLGTDHLYIGGEGYEDKAGGVAAISENLTNPKNGLLAYTTSSYNTGWMPGDTKLAALSDTKTETVGVDESTELVVDDSNNWVGDFNVAADVSEWTGSGGTIDGSLGYVRITQTTNSTAYLTIPINTVVGKKYKISADIRTSVADTVNTGAAFYIGETAYQNDVALRRPMVSEGSFSSFSLEFVATTSVTHITLASWAQIGDHVEFDNVSVKQTGELITNGTFEDGTTGWTETSSPVLTVTNNKLNLKCLSGDNQAGVHQNFLANDLSRKYILSFDIDSFVGDTAANLVVGVDDNSNLGGTELFSGKESGSYSFAFNGRSGGMSILFRVYDTTGTCSEDTSINISNISVRLAEEDRSVNNNGLQIFGEIDKTPVAPGADLVAYSGFSADDYLMQPYNSDLDFGTGDFCVMGWAKTTSAENQKIFTRDLNLTNRFQIYINNGGVSVFTEEDDQFSYLEGSTDVNNGSWFNFFCIRRSGVLEVYVNGKQETAQSSGNHETARNLNFGQIASYAGIHIHNSENYFQGSIALLRISKTAPTAEQIAKIYRDEKVLFQDGAQATLYGTSDAVTALAYDDSENLLHVGTASGRSSFNGLKRIDNTTTAVTTAISATEGLVIEQ